MGWIIQHGAKNDKGLRNMNMIRKGQILGVGKGAVTERVKFATIFWKGFLSSIAFVTQPVISD